MSIRCKHSNKNVCWLVNWRLIVRQLVLYRFYYRFHNIEYFFLYVLFGYIIIWTDQNAVIRSRTCGLGFCLSRTLYELLSSGAFPRSKTTIRILFYYALSFVNSVRVDIISRERHNIHSKVRRSSIVTVLGYYTNTRVKCMWICNGMVSDVRDA